MTLPEFKAGTQDAALILQRYKPTGSVAQTIGAAVASISLPGQALHCIAHGLAAAKQLTQEQQSAIRHWHDTDDGGETCKLPDVTYTFDLSADKLIIRQVHTRGVEACMHASAVSAVHAIGCCAWPLCICPCTNTCRGASVGTGLTLHNTAQHEAASFVCAMLLNAIATAVPALSRLCCVKSKLPCACRRSSAASPVASAAQNNRSATDASMCPIAAASARCAVPGTVQSLHAS